TNSGTKVNEFEVLAADGLRIIGELENIGPNVTRELTVALEEGDYQTACVPGMIGAGTRAPFKVTAGEEVKVSDDRAELQKKAIADYKAYVKSQVAQLVEGTDEFVAAFESGDTEKAKELYAPTRAHYERIEPLAESFGDLDPLLDIREPDVEDGDEFTGWHRAEKDLWSPKGYKAMSDAERKEIADGIKTNTKKLYDEVFAEDYEPTINDIGNGSVGLMDEVATSKITGEEEAFSHTDLWDFAANVDGAKVAYETLKPLLENSGDTELSDELDKRFEEIATAVDEYKDGEGYKYYDDLSDEQIKALSDQVLAVKKPLEDLTKTATKAQ
ncbi:iron uptake system protein EfeO, partial [Galactobacter sp.]|uniref:iron uptake system protein EfeO n=1 Tax=Galactobacter sp. TaxID=2676125 RepID=UPI0025C5E79B